MSEPNSIKINEVEYVRKDAQDGTKGDIKIAVLDRGFVYVGRVSFEGEFIILKDALNVRKWGTTRGLGELVNGPLSGTVLDKVGTVTATKKALMHLIDVEQKKWSCI